MQSEGPSSGQTAGDNGSFSNDSPVVMSATSGPIQAHEYFWPSYTPSASPNDSFTSKAPASQLPTETARYVSPSPARAEMRSASESARSHLTNAKSTPALVPSGSVKNIANQFNQAGAAVKDGKHPPLTVRTSQDRYRRPGVTKNPAHITPLSPRSPTKDSGVRKLQKSRPGRQRSPVKSPGTSFEASSSFSSTATVASTKSQPHAAFSPRKQPPGPQPGPYMTSRPLFGEITADGRWNGNFDLGSHGQLSTFDAAHRRSSDGAVALGHGRSQSHQDILQPAATSGLSAPHHQTLNHKRSRSEMDRVPSRNAQRDALYPTPPDSETRHNLSPASRIPVSSRRRSNDGPASGPQSRSTSALSNPPPNRNRLSKSPTRKAPVVGKENAVPTSIPRSRYQASNMPNEANGQTLSAKIVAPLPKLSPPLRSSRPRQPVSSATTSASRARAAEQFQNPNAPRDGRRPSEQWLGKPYDPQKEQAKRKIPELSKIDFEERRARIQKAISQNVEQTRSLEELRAKSRSRQASKEPMRQSEAGSEKEAQAAEEPQAEEGASVQRESVMPGGWPTPGGLTVDTFQPFEIARREMEPMTASTERTTATEFEVDESPILGKFASPEEQPMLLTSATYQPPSAKTPISIPPSVTEEAAPDLLPSQSVLDNVMRMRERSSSRTSRSPLEDADEDDPASADDSPSDLEDKWGLNHGLNSVQGSIKIMLDHPWSSDEREEVEDDMEYNEPVFSVDDFTESPQDSRENYHDHRIHDTPRGNAGARISRQVPGLEPPSDDFDDIGRVLRHYKSTGTITQQMLEQVQRHMVDLQRVSANEGSNGFMIQSLLDSVLNSQREDEPVDEDDDDEDEDMIEREQGHNEMLEIQPTRSHTLEMPSHTLDMSSVTPDTPIGWEFEEEHGTALIFSNEPPLGITPEEERNEEEPFHVKVQSADAAFDRRRRPEYLRLGAEENDEKPAPPPKDVGYTPQPSPGPESAALSRELEKGLRISTTGHLDLPGFKSPGARLEPSYFDPDSMLSTSAPPQPSHAPPPPPPASASATHLPFDMPEVPRIPAAYSERGSNELSRKDVWGASGSSRPSTDSQRPLGPPPVPASVSVTSLSESFRQTSMDDSQTRLIQTTSQSPEQKRLAKRRMTMKELLDTENSYHQDLKIIEDIYKATAVADVISPEDKKILFSNCDEIERFSLHFYDELRKAAAPVYVPAKKGWANKRGSISTTQSDGTGQTAEAFEDEKDRATTIGQAFLQNLQHMEQVYSVYLKNHDAANQRLSALRNTPTVKCWLDECHNNASDITSAWDLDSLLVKPTQRVAKYPMLLQQLLDTTPTDHSDKEALSAAAKDSINMLTRINDAKKRADLVDQIVNRKRKESDVRTGIAKAFGRRTEKLKERVGIAEAFQDPEFDDLAHKFGGHFIRLQICMRDVQDYMNRIDKAMEQINNYAFAVDFFADVSVSPMPELDSKWRKFGQAIREIISVAFADHKNAVNKRVISPMVTCIKLHEGPQNAINDRKKRIVDYVKCKSIEKRNEKPDKKTIEASDLYEALNDQLKIELPKLYNLTANLVQGCLNCFLDIQLTWYNTLDRKLRPILEAVDIPSTIQEIEPAFRPEFDMVKGKLLELGICNGAVLADSANFLSPTMAWDDGQSSGKRPSTLDSGKRTMSVGSESSPAPGSSHHKRQSSGYIPGADMLAYPYEERIRSDPPQGIRSNSVQTPGSVVSTNQGWPNGNGYSGRPATANAPSTPSATYLPPRTSADQPRSPRPMSGATYFTARPDQQEDHRFSNIFSSALPKDVPDSAGSESSKTAPDDTQVLFVCASLFEFSIDKTRKEGGYPYLTYMQGEVFDVVAQKGELWLAKNQDDASNSLGWIWEQHFVILSQD